MFSHLLFQTGRAVAHNIAYYVRAEINLILLSRDRKDNWAPRRAQFLATAVQLEIQMDNRS